MQTKTDRHEETRRQGIGALHCLLFTVLTLFLLAPRAEAQSAPSVTVTNARGIGVGTATLNGGVTATNGSPTTFFFMWGTNDYGTALTNPWTMVNCGVATNGQSFSTNLTGLTYGIRYWYYTYATNASGPSWSSATNFLTVSAPWTPAYLPSTTNALWLDAADASTVLCNGTAVTNWLDKSGNNRTFAQTTGSLQPTYTTGGLNGLSVIDFAADYLTSTNAASTWKFMHDGTKYSLFVVVKPGISADPIAAFPAEEWFPDPRLRFW